MINGTVSDYAADMEMGVINTHDDKKYIFSKPDWLSFEITPKAGLIVTFEATIRGASKITVVSQL
jgi:hypothetical protein